MAKRKGRIRSTMMTVMKKRTAAIDFKRPIDQAARLTAHLDHRRRVGASAKKTAHRNPRN